MLLGGSLRRLDALGRAFGRLLGAVASRRCALGVGSSLIGSGRGSIFGTFSALIDALSHGLLALGACVGLLAGALAFDSALVKNDGVAISVNRRHACAVLGAFLLGIVRHIDPVGQPLGHVVDLNVGGVALLLQPRVVRVGLVGRLRMARMESWNSVGS